MNYLYLIGLPVATLLFAVGYYFLFKRNYFNKYKYIRLERYHEDMSITVSYIKKDKFNLDDSILINPQHIYNFKGYQTVILTSRTQESINPIDFESKFDPSHFKSAMKSKLIAETFASLKVDKFDKLMMILFVNIIILVAIAYLIYNLMGNV